MFLTESAGWDSLRALRSRLSGKLARFTRRTSESAPTSRSQKLQNDAAFFEADLHYVFTAISTADGLPGRGCEDLDRGARDLVASLNDIVNQRLVEALTELGNNEIRSSKGPSEFPSTDSHDITFMSDHYPRLYSLLTLLETSTGQFSLTTAEGSSLFLLPEGAAGDIIMDQVIHIKELLESLAPSSQKSQRSQMSSQVPTEFIAKESTHGNPGVPEKHASVVVSTIFNELRRRSCGTSHEIKLKVSDEWQTGSLRTPLDIFLSCCLDERGWHRAKCGSFQAMVDEGRKDGVCAAIQRAKEQGRTIYLSVDKRGLCDISDTMPTARTLGTAIAAGIFDPKHEAGLPVKRLIATAATEQSQRCLEDELSGHVSRLAVLTKQANVQAVQEADVVVLAFKPSERADVFAVPGFKEASCRKLVLSIMAGITIGELSYLTLGANLSPDISAFIQAVRAMPNIAARIREAVTLYTPSAGITTKNLQIASWVYSQVGEVHQIPENSFDICTVLVGCAGSLLLLAVDGLLDAAVAEGPEARGTGFGGQQCGWDDATGGGW